MASATQLVDEVLALQLSTTTRAEIESRKSALSREIDAFTRNAASGADVEGRLLRIEADSLRASAPGEPALAFSAFTYVQNAARLLRRLVAHHGEVAAQPEDGAIASRADPEPRRPSGLATVGQIQWLSGVAG
ncbi:hypothetical protein GR131_27660 [Streptomyces sp. GF20]|uniref:hypothetical protein n=1 Tax=Streptomyces sp. GF20 TaxID=2692235 RepID=UPI001319136C|nr:hypothetical protein [Streptomyces sp. GF20]QHC18907.1 hypothetical protein GR131_27660 [Streptomyces sp. GF20]